MTAGHLPLPVRTHRHHCVTASDDVFPEVHKWNTVVRKLAQKIYSSHMPVRFRSSCVRRLHQASTKSRSGTVVHERFHSVPSRASVRQCVIAERNRKVQSQGVARAAVAAGGDDGRAFGAGGMMPACVRCRVARRVADIHGDSGFRGNCNTWRDDGTHGLVDALGGD